MKIFNGIKKISKFRNPVVAMGVFDGVHKGHREILKAAVRKAQKIGGLSVAFTFWPHPQQEESLYSLEHRLQLIAELGVDVCIIVRFSKHFSKISASSFIKNILVKKINVKYIYVGSDFKFGKGALGDLDLLREEGKFHNFGVKGFRIIKVKGRPIRSTLIRSLIKTGKIKDAEKLLGRRVSVLGSVIKGTALGRILGFPTANIDPHHEVIPASGIYAVRIILDKHKLKGACYIGKRPTIEAGNNKINIEVHIFNFNTDIYGKYLEIQFVKKIRSDKKFNSLDKLALQIKKDLISAKKIPF